MNPLTHSSSKDIQLPELSSDIETFTDKATACFEAIQTCTDPVVMNNEKRQQKYFKLQGLRERIKTLNEDLPKKLIILKCKIKKEMRALKEQYQTNSHWLVLTQKQSHLVQTQPNISVVPRVRIDPSDLQTSFNKITELPRSIEKVRALQFLFEQATQADENNVPELLADIQRFSDSHLSLSEKILALKQINWRDKNPKQISELNSLIDPTGRNFVQHFLHTQTDPKDTVNYITVVLKDRLLHNASLAPLELMKSWPKSIDKQDPDTRITWTLALLKMQSKSSIYDSFTNLAISYMLNVFDPTGLLRCESLHKKYRSGNSFAEKVAGVIDDLETFDLDPYAIHQQYSFVKKESDLKDCPFLVELEKKIVSKSLKQKEIAQFAAALKVAAAKDWLTFDMKTFMNGSKSFQELVGNRMEMYAKLADRYKNTIKTMKTPQEQATMISNLLLLCQRLMATGEFGLSFTLFASGIDNTRNSCEKAWEIALAKYQKQDNFLQKVCSPLKNLKNLRKLIANREAKTACIPFFPITLKDIIQLEEQISQPRDNLIEQVFNKYPLIADQITKSLAKKQDLKKPVDWAKSNFFKDLQKLFRVIDSIDSPFEEKNLLRKKIVAVMEQERELQLEIMAKKRVLNRGIALISLHYSKQFGEDNLSSLLPKH